MTSRPVLIDTDCALGMPGADIDDAFAIALLLASGEVELVGITTVSGNTTADNAMRSVRLILELAERTEIAVSPGKLAPSVEPEAPWRRVLDAAAPDSAWVEGFGFAPRPQSSATEAIVEAAKAHRGRLEVLAIGPLTNVAEALRRSPEVAGLIARLYIMGGAFNVPDVVQELNFGYDPEAARTVFRSGVPIELIPLDATVQTELSDCDRDALAAGGPLARKLAECVTPWMESRRKYFGGRAVCLLNDPLAAALMIDNGICEWRGAYVDVEIEGELARGRSISWQGNPGSFVHPTLPMPKVSMTEIAERPDNGRLVSLLLERVRPL